MFFNILEVLTVKKPHVFLLENVKNLVYHDKGQTFSIIINALKEIGYSVHWRIYDGKDFVPQHRERIFIAGFRQDNGFYFIDKEKENHSLSEILHRKDYCIVEEDEGRYTDSQGMPLEKYTLSDRMWNGLKVHKARQQALGHGFGYGLCTPADISRTLSARYYKDGSDCLIADVNGGNPRRLTPRECARLMGFPDTFKIPVSDTRAYHAFGNSVVVPLIKWIAELMLPFIPTKS